MTWARLTQLMFGSHYTWLDMPSGAKVYASSLVEPGTCEMPDGLVTRVYLHPQDVEKMRGELTDHLVTGQD